MVMCLNIDGQVFCSVLGKVFYNGKSLEIVEHELEEGEVPYTAELEVLIANTCGLSLEIYRDRVTRLRSMNVTKQCERYPLVDRFAIYFALPAESMDYIEGSSHIIPTLSHVTPEAQTTFARTLVKRRFDRFCERIDHGMTREGLGMYPERDEWVPFVLRQLRTFVQPSQDTFGLTITDTIPPDDVFYPDGRREHLLRRYTRWFYDKNWRQPPLAINFLMSAGDIAELNGHIQAYHQFCMRKPKGRRTLEGYRQHRDAWRAERHAMRIEWRTWKHMLMKKYLEGIEHMLSGYQSVPLSKAA